MARALSNGKALVFALSDGIAAVASRRGSAAEMAARGVIAEDEAAVDDASGAWVPDPVTGYYRPANWIREMDPVELRRMLLKQ